MIIKTRYRDVPWEETGCPTKLTKQGEKDWSRLRGTEIEIEVPAWTNQTFLPSKKPENRTHRQSACDQPKYLIAGGLTISVCPHIAEIGD